MFFRFEGLARRSHHELPWSWKAYTSHDTNIFESFTERQDTNSYSVHGDTVHDPRSDLSQGGGDDAEHPMVISMHTFIAAQVPSGPTGLKVNPLLFKIYMNIHWTWSLPHHRTLCIIRDEDDRQPVATEHPGGQGEGPQGHEEEGKAQQ